MPTIGGLQLNGVGRAVREQRRKGKEQCEMRWAPKRAIRASEVGAPKMGMEATSSATRRSDTRRATESATTLLQRCPTHTLAHVPPSHAPYRTRVGQSMEETREARETASSHKPPVPQFVPNADERMNTVSTHAHNSIRPPSSKKDRRQPPVVRMNAERGGQK